MVSRIAQWTLDVHDINLMGEFWAAVLGYRIDKGDDGALKLYPPDSAPEEALTVWLQPTTAPKIGKNRDHLDLYAPDGNFQKEIDRVLALGARRVDVGQTGHEAFEVLADPEGNEFCILHRRTRGV